MNDVPADTACRPSCTGRNGFAVNAFEWDTATIGAAPFLVTPCTELASQAAFGCFAPDGDVLRVDDEKPDGHSAAVSWNNYDSNGNLYRHGACVNRSGSGTSAICNKNFAEHTKIKIMTCTFESATKTKVECTDWSTGWTTLG